MKSNRSGTRLVCVGGLLTRPKVNERAACLLQCSCTGGCMLSCRYRGIFCGGRSRQQNRLLPPMEIMLSCWLGSTVTLNSQHRMSSAWFGVCMRSRHGRMDGRSIGSRLSRPCPRLESIRANCSSRCLAYRFLNCSRAVWPNRQGRLPNHAVALWRGMRRIVPTGASAPTSQSEVRWVVLT